jgi:aryl-alcohol dehydrogenase-like predicted oxidoreductase
VGQHRRERTLALDEGRSMEFRNLGRTGLKISEIAYGNWLTHGSQVEAEQATACVREALEVGITTFDTADVYAGTKAESVLGDALKGVRRESYELFSKVYWPTGPGQNDRGLSRKHIIESCHGSLRRLQTDHLDLYQAHRYDNETPLEETLRAFDDLVRAGKVMYVGVSEWNADQIRRALDIADERGYDRIVSNQPQYSMLWRVIEPELVPLCEKEGIGQIVWSPIAQGALTGKYLPGQPPPEGSRATDASGGADMIKRFMNDDVLERVQRLKPLAQEAGLTMAQLAVAWVLAQPTISAAIIGASRPEQVRENAAASGRSLDPALLAKIDEVLGEVVERDPARTASPAKRP